MICIEQNCKVPEIDHLQVNEDISLVAIRVLNLIRNAVQGMLDRQVKLLTEVLKKGRIWALNIGENMNVSRNAWERFAEDLKQTRVSFMYVSEHHLVRTNLKQRMMDAIRENRRWLRLSLLALSVQPSHSYLWKLSTQDQLCLPTCAYDCISVVFPCVRGNYTKRQKGRKLHYLQRVTALIETCTKA